MKAEYINHMGDDLTVVNAARVSFDKQSEWEYINNESEEPYDYTESLSERDCRLLHYLGSHNHWTPFSHPQITLRETVPIFVSRQRFKHVVGFSYNEVSRRYVDSDPEFYIPKEWRGRPEGSVKQGSSEDVVIDLSKYHAFKADEVYLHDDWDDYTLLELEAEHRERSLILYKSLIKVGIAPEQARMVLPQSMYTSYYVTGSLAAWARAYNLRSSSDAQSEIRELASQWKNIIEPLYPVSWKVLTNA